MQDQDIVRGISRRKVLTHHFMLREIWGGDGDVQYLRVYIRGLRQNPPVRSKCDYAALDLLDIAAASIKLLLLVRSSTNARKARAEVAKVGRRRVSTPP
jgi:hypothetical protein